MSSMSGSGLAFVDTNILVHAFTDGPDARHRKARDLVAMLTAEDRLCLSTQVLNELFVTLTRKHQTLVEVVLEILGGRWPVFQVDPRTILDAGR